MLDLLAGVPGKLKTLVDRLSSVWAAQLDTLATRLSATWAAKVDTLAADYTTAKSAYLNATISSRAAEDTPLLDVPISSGLMGRVYGGIGSTSTPSAPGFTSINTNNTTLTDAINYTGAGVLEGLTQWVNNLSGQSVSLEVIIDGVTVLSVTSSTTVSSYALPVVGDVLTYYTGSVVVDRIISGDGIPFKTSLQVRHSKTSGNNSSYIFYRYRKTG